MLIGIDIGGTNTDAVLMHDNRVLASYKAPTSADVQTGIEKAIRSVLTASGSAPSAISRVVFGTTHFTNAVVQRRNLQKVCAVRLGAPASQAFPPFSVWPQELADTVRGLSVLCRGGVNFDNSPISTIDEKELRQVAARCADEGITSVALTSIFAPLSRDGEQTARDIMVAENSALTFTLSSDIGSLGVLERENATILNACLATMAEQVMSSIAAALTAVGTDCPFFLSQNDGTLMSAAFARQYPVRTFASGPTNSIRGAGYLADITDGLVVDIGGTTTDVGALRNGYPRESANTTELAGLRTNFRMPDIVSVGVGGGSLVDLGIDPIGVGPTSVGSELLSRAMVFGGSELTATDIAVAGGYLELGDRSAVAGLDPAVVAAAVERIRLLVERAADSMRLTADPVPVVVVGGGAALLTTDAFAGQQVLRPEYADVANAVGSAIALAGGEADRIFDLEQMSRQDAIAAASAEATEQCVAAGASPTGVDIVELDVLPLTYLPGRSVRIRVKAAGSPSD